MYKILNFITLLVSLAGSLVSPDRFTLSSLDTSYCSEQTLDQLQNFESAFIYPFSDNETFTIKHGIDGDYFKFFKQLGQPDYYQAISKSHKTVDKVIDGKKIMVKQNPGDIAAVLCCVLRTFTTQQGEALKAWYICDLKVNPHYQREHLPLKMVQKIALKHFWQCPRGFAICMNPMVGDPQAVTIFKKHGPLFGLKTQTLNLYTLSAQQVIQYYDQLKKSMICCGYLKESESLGFQSTSGAKDYAIFNKTTQQTRPWHLFHMQSNVNTVIADLKDATYMICAVEDTHLDYDFKKIIGKPTSTAQIISYGMEKVDFNVLTSNQI